MTILFAKDWYDDKGKPRAVVHSTTKNKSFVRAVATLLKMGIKNNLFPLSLYDPMLIGVDPHSLNVVNDPDSQLRLRVAMECKKNAWYFLREVIRIPSAGGDPISFGLHRGNMAMAWCYCSHIDFNGTMPRQMGKTISAIALSCWVTYISGWKMNIGMLTHSDKLIQENVKRIKDMRDGLPSYLINRSGDDVDNKQGLDYKSLHNGYLTFVGREDKLAANRVARGSTFPTLHIDETAYIPNIRITFPTIMTTTNAARISAKLNGQMYSSLYTTTAGDPSTDSGDYAHSLIVKAMPFTEKLYDCVDEDAAHKMVKINSSNNLVNGTFSYLQLGKTHDWFRETITRNNTPPDEIERDYLNNWVSLAKNPIIAKDVLAKITYSRRDDPLFREVVGDYLLSWYVPESVAKSAQYRSKPLIMGMDSSEMIGQDFTTFVCIDPKDLSVVFTFRCNDSNTTKIGLLVADILIDFPHMLFVPERKSTGLPIIDTVIMMLVKRHINPFFRIFNRIVDQRDLAEFKDINLHETSLSDSTARKYLGFMTTGASRPVLYKQVLQRAAGIAADKIYDPVLIQELSGLQATNGRIDHAAGRHDDMVISFLLACYVVFEGKNLHYYGIQPSDILSQVETVSGKSPEHVATQIILRKQIRDLEDQIKKTPNDYLKRHFTYKARQIEQHLDPDMVLDPVSVETLRTNADQYGSAYKPTPVQKKAPYSINTLIQSLHF